NQALSRMRRLPACLIVGSIMLATVLVAQPAFGVLATDVVTSTDSSSKSTSLSSSSFSTNSGNELLLAFISTDANSSGINVTGITGAGVTWTLVKRTNAQMGTAEIW